MLVLMMTNTYSQLINCTEEDKICLEPMKINLEKSLFRLRRENCTNSINQAFMILMSQKFLLEVRCGQQLFFFEFKVHIELISNSSIWEN